MPAPGLVSCLRTLALLTALACTLWGCGTGESNVERGNREGVLHYGNGGEPEGLDPHVVSGLIELHILSALFEGLVTKNPYTLEPEPGVARSWDVSEDGRLYTFQINPAARWSNGEAVTAGDYVWSWERALNPDMGNRYASMLFSIVGAKDYSSGAITDFSAVGVKALDELTLQVTLASPTPYFLQLLDHHSTYAVHPETILAHGAKTDRFTPWTRVENMVGNGPFKLVDWQLNRRIRVEKSDTYWERDKVKLKGVVFYPIDSLPGEERMFRAGQLHYTQSVPLEKGPVYQAMEHSPYRQAPYLGTYFYGLNTQRPPLTDRRVRRALSLAIDRQKLVDTVLQKSYPAAYAITPPGTMGYQPPRMIAFDPDRARQLLAEAGYPGGEDFPPLEVIFNTSENHRKIAVALQQMWKAELNIDITLANQEWKVYQDSVKRLQFDISRRSWIGDYVDANNFLELFITGSGNNRTGFSHPRYDELLLELAPGARSREERYAYLFEAETLLMQEMPILPLYTYTSQHLVHPSVRGMPPNLMDAVNLKYVWLDPDWAQSRATPGKK